MVRTVPAAGCRLQMYPEHQEVGKEAQLLPKVPALPVLIAESSWTVVCHQAAQPLRQEAELLEKGGGQGDLHEKVWKPRSPRCENPENRGQCTGWIDLAFPRLPVCLSLSSVMISRISVTPLVLGPHSETAEPGSVTITTPGRTNPKKSNLRKRESKYLQPCFGNNLNSDSENTY